MTRIRLVKKMDTNNVGKAAEKAALKYLQHQGLMLLEKNFRSRFGEIDLIMQSDKTVVFVEVRCRKRHNPVTAAESITPQKIKKIIKTAEYYLMSLDFLPDCRFDVMAMTHNPADSSYTIDWLQQAF